MPDGWVRFWFEGNRYFEFVSGPNDWLKVLKAYGETGYKTAEELRRAKRCDSALPHLHKFGFAIECSGEETLGEWADKNGMNLDLLRYSPAPEDTVLVLEEEA